MDKSQEGFKEESTQNSKDLVDSLVISINSTGKIVQFNKICERVTGYSREEALNKELFDFLIPKSYSEDWSRLFNLARQDRIINDLELPWLSRYGKEIMISWNSFPVEEIEGTTEDICLVGKMILNNSSDYSDRLYTNKTTDEKESILNFIRVGLKKERDSVKKNAVAERKGVNFGIGNKRIVIKEADSKNSKDVAHKDSKKVIPKGEKVQAKSKQVEVVKPSKTLKTVVTIDEKKIDEILKFTLKNYENTHKTIKELEKRNEKLETENKKLEQNLKSIKAGRSFFHKHQKQHEKAESNIKKSSIFLNTLIKRKDKEYDKIYPEKDKVINKTIKELEKRNEMLEKEKNKLELNLIDLKTRISEIEKDKKLDEPKDSEPIKNKTSFLVDSLRGKKKQEELDRMILELDERKNFLDDLETQLTREKTEINEQRNQFRKWREKLELLEEEIEKRRVELIEQERIFKDQLMTSPTEEVPYKSSTKLVEEIQEVHHEILDKIPESAAIVKRGILKQVNHSFVELLGYNIDMLLEKSLLDFIAPEGISGIEDYYIKRLKGEAVSKYETMFLTKNNDKLMVRVNLKPTTFEGEKAEIAVFNRIEKKH